jgi:chromosome segregation ATPase
LLRIDDDPQLVRGDEPPLGDPEDPDEVQYYLFFFNFLRGAYERWLAEGDEPVETFEREMTALFAKDSERVEQLHSQLERQLEEKRRELESLERSDSLREALNSEILQTDQRYRERAAFLQRIQMEYDSSGVSLNKLKEELSAGRLRVQRADSQLNEARRELDQKGINTEQLKGVLCEVQRIEQQTNIEIQRQQVVIQDRRQVLKSCQDEISAIVELAGDMNRALTSLGLIPELSVNPSGNSMIEIIGTELPSLLEKVTEHRGEIQGLESGRQQMETDRSAVASQIREVDMEIQEITSELKSLNENGGRDIRQLKKTHDSLVEQARERQRSMRVEKAEAEKKMKELEEYFKRYREHVNETLARVVNEARLLDDSLNAM